MAFLCPECTVGSLRIEGSLELPPDSRSDEITLQAVSCQDCGFSGLGVYEESRRGSLYSEVWYYTVYRVEEEYREEVLHAIADCPLPRSPHCPCPGHDKLGQRNGRGRWIGLKNEAVKNSWLLH